MKSFSVLDAAAVFAYLFAIAAIGAAFYRKGSTAKEYFLGGRSMSWLPTGISLIAADLSAISVMGSPAGAYKNDSQILWVAVGYPLVAPLAILIFVPFYSRLNLYTAYEYLERRFSLSVRLVTSALFQLLRSWHVALAIYGPALVINMVTDLPVWACILMMGVFTTGYTTLGGIKAVIWTDVVQFTAVTCGIGLILVTALRHVPGGLHTAFVTAREHGKLHLLNLSTDPAQLTTLWACLIGGSVLALAPLTTDQAILQRLFTTKSAKDCRRSVILQSILVVPIALLLNAVGLSLFAFYQYHPDRLKGLTVTDAIVPFFAVRELPSGVTGLVIAAIFAASMAVMSAGINSLTTATTIDFYQRVLRRTESSEHYASAGRLGTALWGAAVTLLALFADRAGDLAIAYSRVSSFISGPMLGIFLLGGATRRATANGCLIGAAGGAAAVGLAMFYTHWSFYYFGAIGTVTTLGAGYLASLAMEPPERRNIEGLVMGRIETKETARYAI